MRSLHMRAWLTRMLASVWGWQEGVRGLYRGVSAVVVGAIPGHALHFMVYEVSAPCEEKGG